jgi:hypothetical protein
VTGRERYEKGATILFRALYVAFAIWAYDRAMPLQGLLIGSFFFYGISALVIEAPKMVVDFFAQPELRRSIGVCLAITLTVSFAARQVTKMLGLAKEEQTTVLLMVAIVTSAFIIIVALRRAHEDMRQRKAEATSALGLDHDLPLYHAAADQDLDGRDALLNRA